MGRVARFFGMPAAVFGSLLLATACSEDPRTQLMAILVADDAVRAQASAVEITVEGRPAGADGAWQTSWTRRFSMGAADWPRRIAIVPAEDDPREVRIEAVAVDEGGPIVRQVVRTRFVEGQTLAVPIRLESACIASACPAEQTCRTGDCVDPLVPPESLAPYDPGNLPAADGGSQDGGRLDGGGLDGGADGGVDGGTGSGVDGGPPCLPATTNVDLVLMVDSSGTMVEEQGVLPEIATRIAEAFSTRDFDGDGAADVDGPVDLRIGVITPDLGTGGEPLANCTERGDDAELQTEGYAEAPSCDASYPAFLGLDPGGDPDAFASDLGCVARVGLDGCGFEQQLEAALKAVTPSTSPIVFFDDTAGQEDRANDGFLRDDSLLVLMMLTDEDDCSTSDPGLFEPTSVTYPGDLNLRCAEYPAALRDLDRYLAGFRALRPRPEDFAYFVIAGIPEELEGASLDAILDDSRMEVRVEPDPMTGADSVVPACERAERGKAQPARRLVELGRTLRGEGSAVGVGSICAENLLTPVNRMLTRIAERLPGTCE